MRTALLFEPEISSIKLEESRTGNLEKLKIVFRNFFRTFSSFIVLESHHSRLISLLFFKLFFDPLHFFIHRRTELRNDSTLPRLVTRHSTQRASKNSDTADPGRKLLHSGLNFSVIYKRHKTHNVNDSEQGVQPGRYRGQ